MDPVSVTLLSVGTKLASGMAGMAAAQGEKLRADINAYIGETRAIQTNTVAMQNLESELSTVRNVFATNGQRMTSDSFGLLQDVRTVRNREKRISVGNERRRAMDQRIAGQNAQARGTGALIRGIGGALPSIFDLAQLL